ncbi:vacuolar protein sorting-associated protein 9A [Pelomyxa schiedti]|nr:vacuolar protein sorting-associated protein 9A [Pelomyxa schiedti]
MSATPTSGSGGDGPTSRSAVMSQSFVINRTPHEFEQLAHFSGPTWCGFCGKFLWGLGRQGLQCKHCSYAIHEKCRSSVTNAGIMCSISQTPVSAPPPSPKTPVITRSQSVMIPAASLSPILPHEKSATVAISTPSTPPLKPSTPPLNAAHSSAPPSTSTPALSTTPLSSTPTPTPSATPPTTPIKPEASILFIAESLFSQLPINANMFKSGRLKIDGPSLQIDYRQQFPSRPKVCAWVMVAPSQSVLKISNEFINISQTHFSVTLPPEKFDEWRNMPINWLAYSTPTANPVLVDCINQILACAKNTPALTKKVEDSIMANTIHGVSASGQTLLHAASYAGNYDLVTSLVDKWAANIDAQDDRGWTPLMCCLDNFNYRCAMFLLQKNCKTNLYNNRKNTALHFLLKKACNTPDTLEILKILLASCDPNFQSGSGQTPLMLAVAEQNNTTAVQYLLEAGAKPNETSTDVPPLVIAASNNCVPVLELLLSYGADPRLGPPFSTFADVALTSPEMQNLLGRFDRGEIPKRIPHPEIFQSSARAASSGKKSGFIGWATTSLPTLDLVKAISVAASPPTPVPTSSLNASTVENTYSMTGFQEILALPEFHTLKDSVNSLCKQFSRTKYTIDEEGAVVKQLVADILGAVEEHPKLMTIKRDVLEQKVSRYVLEHFYQALFVKKELQQRDAFLSDKIAKLQPHLTPKLLDMREDLDHDLIQSAENELMELENSKTPVDKLTSILNCCKVLVLVLQKAGAAAGADDFLPVFIYTVLHANVPHLHSHLNFIERLSDNSSSANEAFCFYTHLVCAATYIEEQIDPETFKM